MTNENNLIELLKRTLEFYADEGNYEPDSDIIDKDKGSQARFALKKNEEFNLNNTELIGEYLKSVEENIKGNDDVDDLYKTLNELKKLAGDENK